MPRKPLVRTHPLRQRSASVEVQRASACIAVISDTHGHAHSRAEQLVADLKPDAILHGGDIGNLEVLEPFRRIAPLYAVRGNIDGRGHGMPDIIDVEVVTTATRLRILLQHIALYGPKLLAQAAQQARAHTCTLVVCGHSHVPFLGIDKGLGAFNPGSIGPRRFGLPITFGVLDIGPAGTNFRHINCETGERWLPG